ncbi:tRNA guanosine(34) transglycosylase Tgt [Rhabdochlamydiaceae symbiont of Dictyostelium giganteum]|uniref:tRNA guanosine(34) transglycosylase Tgt n=1 Tax=Rhabdochlamydiaceae symbiont of Dictyostelium giganteum TaxID=3342349 RepID=UPI003850537F
MKFEITYQSRKSRARVGKIYTAHGVIDTPNFVAVGTNGALKALDSKQVETIGLQLMFCNTYHLMLQPGTSKVKEAGGIHQFINRPLPIITDSGGFQVFSLAYGSVASELKSQGTKKTDGSVLKITEDGVLFRSYRDGKKILLTPESSIEAQKDLGADIIIPFDELPPYHIEKRALVESLERTHRWEKRSLEAHLKNPMHQSMYAVIHGGVDKELREKSCHTLRELPFDGFAIGGSVGKNKEEMIAMLTSTLPHLPYLAPNHLLGIADLPSIDACIPLGIDTFDSCYPTRSARHGCALSSRGNIHLTQGKYSSLFRPIDEECSCYTCKHYTVAYLNHLFKAKEISALTLTTIHNLHFMVKLMENYRESIYSGKI